MDLVGQVGQVGPVGQVEPMGTGAEEERLLDTQRAFDGVAADYDRSNTENRILSAMRDRVRRAVERFVPAGAHLLDLGCGPGADAEHFGQRGYRVAAIDWSPAMVEQAERRIRQSRLGDRVGVRHLGIHEIDRLAPATFDAVYSNFGSLNCVPDLAGAVRGIAGRLRPGGLLIASVIGRTCPWEVAFYIARGDWRRATVRFASDPVAVPLAGRTVWTRYYSPGSFEQLCAPAGLSRVHLRSLGLWAPPPYLHAFADRHPALIDALERLDDVSGAWPLARRWGDHFLIALRTSGRSTGMRAEG